MKKIIIIMLMVLTLSGCEKKETKKETTQSVEENYASITDKKVGELDIVDFLVVYEDNISTIYFDVVNNTNETISYNNIVINLYDKSKTLILSHTIELGSVEPNSIKSIKESFDANLTKVANVEYELNNK